MGKPNGGISQNKKKDGQEERAEREKKKKEALLEGRCFSLDAEIGYSAEVDWDSPFRTAKEKEKSLDSNTGPRTFSNTFIARDFYQLMGQQVWQLGLGNGEALGFIQPQLNESIILAHYQFKVSSRALSLGDWPQSIVLWWVMLSKEASYNPRPKQFT